MKRQEHLTEVEEVAIRVRVERLKGGRYLGTSRDVPGLVAEGRSVAETVEIAQGLARKIVESCLEHGDALPRVFRNKHRPNREFRVPVSVTWWDASQGFRIAKSSADYARLVASVTGKGQVATRFGVTQTTKPAVDAPPGFSSPREPADLPATTETGPSTSASAPART